MVSPVCHISLLDTALHNSNSREFIVTFGEATFLFDHVSGLLSQPHSGYCSTYVTGGSNVVH